MNTKLTVKGPEDMLAAIPIVLGFPPERSVVMMTFGGDQQFHGRIDLPLHPDAIDGCLDTLLVPAVRHGVRGVVFVLYDAEPDLAQELATRLAERASDCGIALLGCLRVSGGRWFDPLGMHGSPPDGVAFEVDSHPFRAQAVADGRVTRGSRAELAATVAAVPAQVAETEAALETATPLQHHRLSRMVAGGALGGSLAPAQIASLLVSLPVGRLRDAAWESMRRDNAEGHVAFWSDVVRRSPDALVAHPAAVLAFAAWLLGDGALAWCALDRCFAHDPGHSLGLLVSRLLDGAVAPTEWEKAVADVEKEPA